MTGSHRLKKRSRSQKARNDELYPGDIRVSSPQLIAHFAEEINELKASSSVDMKSELERVETLFLTPYRSNTIMKLRTPAWWRENYKIIERQNNRRCTKQQDLTPIDYIAWNTTVASTPEARKETAIEHGTTENNRTFATDLVKKIEMPSDHNRIKLLALRNQCANC